MNTEARNGVPTEIGKAYVRGHVAALRRRAHDRDEAAAALIEAGRWSNLCPAEPSRCTGQTAPLVVHAHGNVPVLCECPLADAIACPHYEARAQVRGAAAEAATIEALVEIGFGPRYHHPKPERIPQYLRGACDEWLESYETHCRRGTTLLLCGEWGCGKTSALAWVARELLGRPQPPTLEYVFSPTLFDEIVASRQAVHHYAEPTVLMIDDLGREHDAAWPMSRFVALMESRYAWYRPTILTSNLNPESMREDALWAPILDRLRESCIAVWEDAPSQRGEDNQ